MNEDLRREFQHIDKHLEEQDRHMSDHFKKFTEHVLEDQQLKNQLDIHLNEHRESKRHRWVIVSGIFLTAISTLGILAVEVLKHFLMKG